MISSVVSDLKDLFKSNEDIIRSLLTNENLNTNVVYNPLFLYMRKNPCQNINLFDFNHSCMDLLKFVENMKKLDNYSENKIMMQNFYSSNFSK